MYPKLNEIINNALRTLEHLYPAENATRKLSEAQNAHNAAVFAVQHYAAYVIMCPADGKLSADKLRADERAAHEKLITALHEAITFLYAEAKNDKPEPP